MATLIRQRCIKLNNPVPEQNRNDLLNELSNMEGIHDVNITNSIITVQYDIFKLSYRDILSFLYDLGHDTDKGFMSRCMSALYDLPDRNEKEHTILPFGYTNEIQNIYLKCQQQNNLD